MNEESKALIERIGGLEAAKRIVENAPEESTHYCFAMSAYYWRHLDGMAETFAGDGTWIYSGFTDLQFPEHIFVLSDLRTAILQAAEKALLVNARRVDAQEINIDSDFNPDSRNISPLCHVFGDLQELKVPPKPKPSKPLYTPLELEQMHKIEHLQCSRMGWRIACAGLFVGGVLMWAGWFV